MIMYEGTHVLAMTGHERWKNYSIWKVLPGSDFIELIGAQNLALSTFESLLASVSNDEWIKQVNGSEN